MICLVLYRKKFVFSTSFYYINKIKCNKQAQNVVYLHKILPLICHNPRPVTICWQFEITGLKL